MQWSSGRKPDEWFHDVFRQDGTPYDSGEVELIRRLSQQPAGSGADQYAGSQLIFKLHIHTRPSCNRMVIAVDSLKAEGLARAVYTQTTDVESEVNGIITTERLPNSTKRNCAKCIGR